MADSFREHVLRSIGREAAENSENKGFVTTTVPIKDVIDEICSSSIVDTMKKSLDGLYDRQEFRGCVESIIMRARHTAVDEPRRVALVHSEISEVLEAIRVGNPPSAKIPEFSSVEEELADAVIRICEWAYTYNYRLGEAIAAKMKYNETRPKQHGGKAF